MEKEAMASFEAKADSDSPSSRVSIVSCPTKFMEIHQSDYKLCCSAMLCTHLKLKKHPQVTHARNSMMSVEPSTFHNLLHDHEQIQS